MTYYKIYCDEGIAGQYAGTLKPAGFGWVLRFEAGFQHYLGSGFEGLFEECCAYVSRLFRGHLIRIDTDPEEERIRKAIVAETIKKAMFSAQKT